MRVFEGKTAPWYIALFAAVIVGMLGLYIWTVPSAGDDQSMVASLLFIAMATVAVLMGVPIKRNHVEVHLGDAANASPAATVADTASAVDPAIASAAANPVPGGHVDVVYGIWRTRIELADIARVERCRSLLAMGTHVAASSSDCVRIFTSAGGIMVIALKDNQGFLDLINRQLRLREN